MGNNCIKTDLTNLIREKAKELWEKDGCKQGRDMDYWLQAEKIVKGQTKKQKSWIYSASVFPRLKACSGVS